MAVDSPAITYPQIAADLLAWYDVNARMLPWRAPPGAPLPDPYRVWLSEIMLQQTTVAAVRPYFEKFTSCWPRPHSPFVDSIGIPAAAICCRIAWKIGSSRVVCIVW